MFNPRRCIPVCVCDADADTDNVKRVEGAGDPTTAVVFLQHKHSADYIAIDNDNQVCCIQLQENDPRCKYAYYLYRPTIHSKIWGGMGVRSSKSPLLDRNAPIF